MLRLRDRFTMMLPRSAVFMSHIFIIAFLTSALFVQLSGAFWEYTPFCYYECCHRSWINRTNSTGLHRALRKHLFGQHLVSDHVWSAINGHLSNNDPPKPLVLSFHGRTGTGKNFVARLIAESIFYEGMRSKFVHIYSANKDFPHKAEIDQYKEKIKSDVVKSFSSCADQLFIFDEMEDMPEGLLDILKPYLDYSSHVGYVDYRKGIFIILSNTAATSITKEVEVHLQRGGKREDIKLRDMEKIIEQVSINEGGYRKSRLIDRYVVSHYLPFLPLEKRHVKECIKSFIIGQAGFSTPEIVDDVLDHLQFVPKDTELFALKGCKNIAEKVSLVLYKMYKDEL